jgi:hypothetical protein
MIATRPLTTAERIPDMAPFCPGQRSVRASDGRQGELIASYSRLSCCPENHARTVNRCSSCKQRVAKGREHYSRGSSVDEVQFSHARGRDRDSHCDFGGARRLDRGFTANCQRFSATGAPRSRRLRSTAAQPTAAGRPPPTAPRRRRTGNDARLGTAGRRTRPQSPLPTRQDRAPGRCGLPRRRMR